MADTHEGNDPMGAPTTHRGPLENCPAPECQDRIIEQQGDAGSVCKFDEGCRRVAPCDPGCGTPLPNQALRDRLVAAIKASPFDELRTVDYAPNGPLLIKVKVDDLADTLMRRLPAVLSPAADRAAVLREAADGFDRHAGQLLDGVGDKAVFVAKALRDQAAVWSEAAETLRRLAAEAQQPADRGAEEDVEVRVARHLDDWEMQSSRTRADRQTLAREVIAIVRADPQPEFQDRGDAARRAAGIDGTAGDAQDLPHAFVLDESTGACLLCGLAPSYRKHRAEAQQPETEEPAPLTPCTCRQAVHALEHHGRTIPNCPWCTPAPNIRPNQPAGRTVNTVDTRLLGTKET